MTEESDSVLGPVTRRGVLKGTVGSIGAASLAGCFGGDDGGGSSLLQFAQAKSPIEFDPIVLNDVPSLEVSQLVFDWLYTYNEEGTEVVPDLASGEPEVERSGQRWIVELKSAATFQNGDKVTAEDVRYTFKRPAAEETDNASEVNMIDSMETVDDETIQFDLAYEFGAFEFYLPRLVVPKSVREDDTDAFNKEKPVGSGPYEFDDWSEGEFVTLTKYDDYWRDREPNIDEIEFQPVEEPTTRITELQNGDKDVVKTVPPANWETVQNMDEASIAEVTGVNYFYLAFNCNEGPTADPQVREAIDYLVSMDSAVERFVEPSGIRANAPIPGTISDAWDFPVSEWESIGHDQDIDQGKSMLDGSSSVPDDWEATIIVPPDDKREDIGTSVANGIQEAGYGATVQRLDWGPFIERYNTGNADKYNMFTLGWSGAPDPDTFLYFLFSQETEGVTNGTFYRNQEVEDAIVTGRESLDRAERKRNYESAVMTILEDRVHLPAYSLRNSFGVRSRVEDFRPHPIDQYNTFTEYNNTSVQ